MPSSGRAPPAPADRGVARWTPHSRVTPPTTPGQMRAASPPARCCHSTARPPVASAGATSLRSRGPQWHVLGGEDDPGRAHSWAESLRMNDDAGEQVDIRIGYQRLRRRRTRHATWDGESGPELRGNDHGLTSRAAVPTPNL